MDHADLTLAVAGALIAAVLLGWLIGSIAGRLNGTGARGLAEARALADRAETAEAALRAAEAQLARVEADTAARLHEAEADLVAATAALDRERRQCDEIRAAYRAAMEGRTGEGRAG